MSFKPASITLVLSQQETSDLLRALDEAEESLTHAMKYENDQEAIEGWEGLVKRMDALHDRIHTLREEAGTGEWQ